MEEVGKMKYASLMPHTEMGKDFKDFESKSQLQLAKLLQKYEDEKQLKVKYQESPQYEGQGKFKYEVGVVNLGNTEENMIYFRRRQFLKNLVRSIPKEYTLPLISQYCKSLCEYDKQTPELYKAQLGKDNATGSFNMALFITYFKTLKTYWRLADELYEKRKKEHELAEKAKLKAYLSEEVECPCGSVYSKRNKSKHFQTKRHQEYEAENHIVEEKAPVENTKYAENQNTKIECPCGGNYTKRNKLKHFETGKHIKYLQSQTPP